MKLTKSLLAILAAIVAAGVITTVQATPITAGSLLNISGSATLDTTSLGTATMVTAWGSDTAAGSGNTGSFAGIAINTPVTMTAPYVFNSNVLHPNLWSVGGFTFNLQTSTIFMQTPEFLDVRGTGTIISGADVSQGVWAFTMQDPGGAGSPLMTFTFSAGTRAVPDSGMAVSLLGLGLVGVAALRAKLKK